MDNVKDNREKYIGGSDIPAIMGISRFNTRWEILQEKAGLWVNPFQGSIYTDYGNKLEPKIREYINNLYISDFKPATKFSGNFRANTDGYDEERNAILEIKTTSNIKKKVTDYKEYLVQLVFYMHVYGADEGILAVYERPDDLNEEFNKYSLYTYTIYSDSTLVEELKKEIFDAIIKFCADVERLKENPLLIEEDFVPKPLTVLADKVMQFEHKLAAFDEIAKQYADLKAQLKEAMQKAGIKKWTTPDGTQITLVPDGEETTAMKFNEKVFKEENPALYEMYEEPVKKKGRTGYVKITRGQNG